jgi:cytidylate kinase
MRVIAIDGPAGAGKSTVARRVADRLALRQLDTGAMYRAVAWLALHEGVALDDSEAIAKIARDAEIEVGDDAVTVNDHDVTLAIRTPEVNAAVTPVAANSAVRAELVGRQRAWALANRGGVIEGRDIGSVVFPEAELKLYLTATPAVRAHRRAAEMGLSDHQAVRNLEKTIADRDASDRGRTDGPLTIVEGAVIIDTSERDIDDIVDEIVGLLR